MIHFENRYRCKDGTYRWLEWSSAPAGNLIYAAARDVTERKRAEEMLGESEERFRQVAESVGDFIWEVDANGLYRYTSPSVERILGYRPDELIGKKHFYDLFVPEVREELKAAAFDVFAAKRAFRAFPNPNTSKEGKVVYLETSGVPMLDESGNLVGFRGADTDVTERKQAEQTLQEKERVLRQNENDLRQLTGRLISAQEEERSRLARELHDDLSQRLAVLSIDAGKLEQQLMNSPGPIKEKLNEMKNQVVKISGDIHNLARQLHPSILDDLGLVRAIESECAAFLKREGINIVFSHDRYLEYRREGCFSYPVQDCPGGVKEHFQACLCQSCLCFPERV